MAFNIPILLIVFNRPEKTKKLFDIISELKPKYLYVCGDGPRVNNSKDLYLCEQVKEIFKNINWKCDFKSIFNKTNKSCKSNVIDSINWFFEHNETGIILEDDCFPSLTFFPFCEILLKRYQSEEKIMQINGFNGGTEFSTTNNESYFFTKLNTTWGWASWKRAWAKFDKDFLDYSKMKKDKKILGYYENEEIADWMDNYFVKSIKKKDNIWSSNWSYTILKNNGLCISPIKNLVENVGFDGSGTSGKSNLFSNYSSFVDNNFKIEKFSEKIEYDIANDEKYFYDIIKKIDPRATKKNMVQKLINYFSKI